MTHCSNGRKRMISVYNKTSANEVFLSVAEDLYSLHDSKDSRCGEMREILHCALSISSPIQRWVFSRVPPINPAFALAEVFWILSGSNDSSIINHWNRKLPMFAGNHGTYYGAYGYRLRTHLSFDQLNRAFSILKNNKNSRQVVLQIWDAKLDLPLDDGTPRNEDIPCNIVSLLKVNDGKLEWSQIIRSNDLILGLPYNIVQYTTLQEIMAGWLEIDMGTYNQYSDSMHLYESNITKYRYDASIQCPHNKDTLSLAKPHSDAVINSVFQFMVLLSSSKVEVSEIMSIIDSCDVPVSYRNIMFVLGAEEARRNGEIRVANEIIGGCKNDCLRTMWSFWSNSHKRKK